MRASFLKIRKTGIFFILPARGIFSTFPDKYLKKGTFLDGVGPPPPHSILSYPSSNIFIEGIILPNRFGL